MMKKYYFLYTVVVIIAVFVRLIGIDFISGDMKYFLIGWYDTIKNNGGINSLDKQVGDYGLLYQTIISFMTYIDLSCVYAYKILSIIFDFALALYASLICKDLLMSSQKKNVNIYIWLTFSIVLLLPTVVLNSSVWGQCDSMYACFCLATLYYLQKRQNIISMVMLGLAFACKLQTVFIMPMVCSYLYKEERLKNIYLYLIALFIFWISGFLTYIEGRNMLECFSIYYNQTNEYHSMYFLFPSFWGIGGGRTVLSNYALMKIPSIILTLIVCATGAYKYVFKDKNNTPEHFYAMSIWFCWTVVLFLPSMHERYAYVLEILIVLLSIYDLKFAKYAIICEVIAIMSYSSCIFIFDPPHGDPLKSIVFTLTYFYFTYKLYTNNFISTDKPISRGGK